MQYQSQFYINFNVLTAFLSIVARTQTKVKVGRWSLGSSDISNLIFTLDFRSVRDEMNPREKQERFDHALSRGFLPVHFQRLVDNIMLNFLASSSLTRVSFKMVALLTLCVAEGTGLGSIIDHVPTTPEALCSTLCTGKQATAATNNQSAQTRTSLKDLCTHQCKREVSSRSTLLLLSSWGLSRKLWDTKAVRR